MRICETTKLLFNMLKKESQYIYIYTPGLFLSETKRIHFTVKILLFNGI
jgi:hypothetical protein